MSTGVISINRVLKTTVFLITAFCLLFSVTAYAADASVYAEQIKAEPGKAVFIPVYIKNISGIMGFKINISYDPDLLSNPSVSAGTVTGKGLFNNSIGVDDAGEFDVVWCSDSDVTEDGTIMILGFTASSKLKDTEIILSYSQADTFNEKWEDVKLNLSPIIVTTGSIEITQSEVAHSKKEPAGNENINTVVINTVEAVLREYKATDFSELSQEEKTEAVSRGNELLSQAEISSEHFFSDPNDMSAKYSEAEKEEFISSALESVNSDEIVKIISEAKSNYDLNNPDSSSENKEKYISEIIGNLHEINPDLASINDILSADECKEVIDELEDKAIHFNDDNTVQSGNTNKTVSTKFILSLAIVLAIIVLVVTVIISKRKTTQKRKEEKKNENF